MRDPFWAEFAVIMGVLLMLALVLFILVAVVKSMINKIQERKFRREFNIPLLDIAAANMREQEEEEWAFKKSLRPGVIAQRKLKKKINERYLDEKFYY